MNNNSAFSYSNTNLINFYGQSDSNKSLLTSGDYLQRKKGFTIYKDVRTDLLNGIETKDVSKSKNGKVVFPGSQDMISFRKAKSNYLNNNKCLKNELDPSTNKINDEGSGILFCPEISKNTKLGGLENFNGVADFAEVITDMSYNVTTTTNNIQNLSLSNNADGDLEFNVTNTPVTTTTVNISVINDTLTPVFGLDCNNLPHFNKYYSQPNPNSLYGEVDGNNIFNYDFSLNDTNPFAGWSDASINALSDASFNEILNGG
jgi:hypothetical protein